MVRALTRSLVAAHADELSVRTGGYILLQLQMAALLRTGHIPQVLNGPTNRVWIEPWQRYLESKHVEFHFGHTVKEFHCADKSIQRIIVSDETGAERPVEAQWYVAALPGEIMKDLVTPEMAQADPGLANLGKLEFRWMNGVMFYLRDDVSLVCGHTVYVDSPWALTSISQRQFWDVAQLGSVGGVKVAGILSVDVSDWESPGVVYGKPAKMCTREEIKEEVLTQIRQHLAKADKPHGLDDANIVDWFVDEDICRPNPEGVAVNLEPLLINATGSWAYRPQAVTTINNLFLASDYARTYTDLATMEGANEAARRAVNGILERSHSTEPPCRYWPLHYPGGLFSYYRRQDRSRLRHADLPGFEKAAELIRQLAERPRKARHRAA